MGSLRSLNELEGRLIEDPQPHSWYSATKISIQIKITVTPY